MLAYLISAALFVLKGPILDCLRTESHLHVTVCLFFFFYPLGSFWLMVGMREGGSFLGAENNIKF